MAASQQGQSDTPTVPAAGQSRRRVGVLVGVAMLVLALDIVTKITVVARLSDRPPIRLLGGASGNLLDRIFRAPGLFRGWVVDWIQIPHWPVFNLADSAIVCGGILAVLLSARGLRLDGQREQR